MKKSYVFVTYFVIIVGLLHIARAPDLITSTWYIADGLMSVFLGFLNISYWRATDDDKLVKWLCLSANFIAFIFYLLYSILFPEIELIITLVLFGYLTFSSFYFSVVKSKIN